MAKSFKASHLGSLATVTWQLPWLYEMWFYTIWCMDVYGIPWYTMHKQWMWLNLIGLQLIWFSGWLMIFTLGCGQNWSMCMQFVAIGGSMWFHCLKGVYTVFDLVCRTACCRPKTFPTGAECRILAFEWLSDQICRHLLNVGLLWMLFWCHITCYSYWHLSNVKVYIYRHRLVSDKFNRVQFI